MVLSSRKLSGQHALPLLLILASVVQAPRMVRADDTLADPWKGQDIGAPTTKGKATVDPKGVYTITAGGNDIFYASDQFHYVYQPITGNFTVVMRAVSITAADDWSKGGPMIRETLDPASNFAMVVLTPANGVSYQYRNPDNSQCGADNAQADPNVWLKLVRKGTMVDAYEAPDKNNAAGDWTQVGGDQKVKDGSVYVGIATVSHSDGTATTFVGDNFQITKN